ncbi:MAG: hypothetical protein V3S64_02530 [bacterium]
MVVKMLAGALLSTALMVVWGVMFWFFLLPSGWVLQSFPDESGWQTRFESELPESGSYYFPLPKSESTLDAFVKGVLRFQRLGGFGTTGVLHYTRSQSNSFSPFAFLTAAGYLFLSAVLGGITLLITVQGQSSYFARAMLLFWLGILVSLAGRLMDPAVLGLPWPYFLTSALQTFTNWIIIGLVMAAFVRKTQGYIHYTDSSTPLWKRALDVD